MKTYSLFFASALLLENTIAQKDDTNKAVRIEPPTTLPALQAPSLAIPSSSYFESVWVKVSAGINTECKTCPNSLCSNKNFYGSIMMFRATCWASGQKINATDMWLNSEEGCFVTAQDTIKYWRNYTKDLKPCQNVPKLAAAPRIMSAKAEIECKRCPNDRCETMKSYERRSEVSITCRAQGLPDCLENCLPSDIPPVNETTVFPWLKTTANCYVKSNSLAQSRFKRQNRPFEDCGPVPYLDFSFRAPPPPLPSVTTVTVTSTLSLYYPVTTTVIIHKNPCEGPNCPPLIWAYTPPSATTTSSPLIVPSNSTGNITSTPISTGGTTIPPASTPLNTNLSPTTLPETTPPNNPVMGPKVSSPPSSTLNANPGITPAPTTNPGITDPGTPIYPVPVEPLPFPQTLNLPPVALRSVVVDPAQGFDNQNSTKLPKCSCEPLNCEGSEGSGDQAICAALAAEKCAKTCPSALKATQAAMDPFHHLMSEGGRPPPNQAQAPSQEYSQEQQSLIDQLSAPDHAP